MPIDILLDGQVTLPLHVVQMGTTFIDFEAQLWMFVPSDILIRYNVFIYVHVNDIIW
jgi:hypothetical protein